MAINFPSSPTTGQSYTDTTTGQTWIYNGTGWASSYNRSSVVRQSFTANAGQTTFTVSGGYAPGLLDVYQNGVKLVSGSDYTATNGTTVVLTVAATAGDSVEVWGIALFTIANMPTLAQLYAETGDAGPISMRNRIINGDMRIDQRSAGAAVTPTDNQVTLDRWAVGASVGSKYTLQQNAGAVATPVGFTNYLGVTSTSAYTALASDYFYVTQKVEGLNVADFAWGSASAVSVTLSFWVRSSLTGTFGGSLRNSNATRSYPFTYSITNANTWEYKTVTIPGDTTGTWLTDNGVGVFVTLAFGAGSTFSGPAGAWAGANYVTATGATSVVGTNGATFYLTGVQLEAGTYATPFERRNYQQELAMCHRYYFKSSDYVTVRCASYNANARAYGQVIILPVTMRTSASVSLSNVAYVGSNSATVELSRSDMWVFYSISAADGSNATNFRYTASAEL